MKRKVLILITLIWPMLIWSEGHDIGKIIWATTEQSRYLYELVKDTSRILIETNEIIQVPNPRSKEKELVWAFIDRTRVIEDPEEIEKIVQGTISKFVVEGDCLCSGEKVIFEITEDIKYELNCMSKTYMKYFPNPWGVRWVPTQEINEILEHPEQFRIIEEGKPAIVMSPGLIERLNRLNHNKAGERNSL